MDPFAVLGVPRSTRDARDVRRAYRRLARDAHPDRGGSEARFDRLTRALDAALAELESGTRRPPDVESADAPRYDWRDGRAAFEARVESTSKTRRGRNANRRDTAREASPSSSSSSSSSSRDRGGSDAPESPSLLFRVFTETPNQPPTAVSRASPASPRRPPVVSAAVGVVDGTAVVLAAALEGGVTVWNADGNAKLGEYLCEKKKTESGEERAWRRATDVWREDEGWCSWDGGPSRVRSTGAVFFVAHDDGHAARLALEKKRGIVRGEPDLLSVSIETEALVGHSDRVTSIRAWIDGGSDRRSFLACTASLDASARLWRGGAFARVRADDHPGGSDPPGGSGPSRVDVEVLPPHDAPLTCCSFAPDARGRALLATGDIGGTYRVWSIDPRVPSRDSSAALLREVRWGGGDDAVTACAFLPPLAPREAGRNAFGAHREARKGADGETEWTLATAHYDSRNDESRVLVWVGPKTRNQTDPRTATTKPSDPPAARLVPSGFAASIPDDRTFEGRVSNLDVFHRGGDDRDSFDSSAAFLLGMCGVSGFARVCAAARPWATHFTVQGAHEAKARLGVHQRRSCTVLRCRGRRGALATVGTDGGVRVYDARDGEAVASVEDAHLGETVRALEWGEGAGGRAFLVTGGADGSVAAWDVSGLARALEEASDDDDALVQG